jgi:cell division protein FtsI (penicillin-binding protein 3)
MPKEYIKLTRVIIGLLVLSFGFLGYRFYTIQIRNHTKYKSIQIAQAYAKVEIPPETGAIFDRNGKILALSRLVDSVYLVPGKLNGHPDNIGKLAAAISISADTLAKQITDAVERKKLFIWVKRRIDDDTSAKLRELKIDGVGFKKEYQRFYPNNILAGQLIGFRGVDEQPLGGVELAYNNYLKGVQGYQYLPRDARQRCHASIELVEKPPQPGHNVYLTIDAVIQSIAEDALSDIAKKYKPAWAGAMVINPDNGEILAMANYPFFDPNNPRKYSDETKRNRIITDVFEPGSVFKPFVITAALEKNAVRMSDTFYCENGKFKVGRRTITDHKPYGRLSLKDVLAKSSNIGMAKIGLATGADTIYPYVRKFGFGQLSGLGFPGEQAGFITPLTKWTNYTVTSVPMGYEISVNTIQLAKAYASFANGGQIIKPQLIYCVADRANKIIAGPAPVTGTIQAGRIFTTDTGKNIVSMLREVVLSGTGTEANLKSYSVAGKTGTSKKLNAEGRYDSKYRGLFIAYAPVENPRILVVAVVDEPKGAYYGGTVAAPSVGKIIDKTLKYLCVVNAERHPAVAGEVQPSSQPVVRGRENTGH